MKRSKSTRPPSQLEETLVLHLMAAGLWPRCVRELRFAPPRRFRFDFAFPHEMLAVECQGGVWRRSGKGAHTGGTAMENEFEKNNVAVEAGWRVLKYTMKEIQSGEAIQQIERILA